MRVKPFEHCLYRILYKLILIDGVDIELRNGCLSHSQFLILVDIRLGVCQACSAKERTGSK